jgi:glyoxylase I family protein
MKIEHVAYVVKDPATVARWWERNLAMKIIRSSDSPPYGHFIADSSGRILFELHCPGDIQVPDYHATDARILYMAFMTDDLTAARDRLVRAGATVVEDVDTKPSGDQLAMLRDPWGFAIQLVRRKESML